MADMVEPFAIDQGTKYPKIYSDPEKVFREKIAKAVETHPYAVLRHGRETIDKVVADELAVYEKTGYTFLGWLIGEELLESTTYNFTENITIKPKFEAISKAYDLPVIPL